MKLKAFAGASTERRSVVIYHGDHLKYPPPCVRDWAKVASEFHTYAKTGAYFFDGKQVSNFSDQWVLVTVEDK